MADQNRHADLLQPPASRPSGRARIAWRHWKSGPRFLSVVGAVLAIITIVCPARAETVRITTGEWKPFISRDFREGGVILHIVREAFARKGLQVEIGFFPWARAVKYIDDGSWDAMAVTGSRFSANDRPHLYSDAVYVGKDVLFHRSDQPVFWQTFTDLHGLTFGAVLSYNYIDAYRHALAAGQILRVVVPNADLLFPMLMAGRFDTFIMDRTAGLYTYNTLYRKKYGDAISYNGRPLATLAYALRFSGDSQKSRRLRDLFNAGLAEMRDAGIIDRYYQQFEQGDYLTNGDARTAGKHGVN